jgi:hypothetical protein
MGIGKLVIEAVVVGLCLAVLLAIAYGMRKMASDKEFGVLDTLVSGLLVGMFFHFGAEASGVNAWYCKNGYACTKS